MSTAIGSLVHQQGTHIGENCHLGGYTWVGLADIGDNTIVASHVEIASGTAQYGTRRDRPMREQYLGPRRVVIGQDVWVGSRAVVAANVAAHSIVGAGAVVISDQETPYALVGGIPAQVIRIRP